MPDNFNYVSDVKTNLSSIARKQRLEKGWDFFPKLVVKIFTPEILYAWVDSNLILFLCHEMINKILSLEILNLFLKLKILN